MFPRVKKNSKKEIFIPSPGQSRINSLSHVQKPEKIIRKKIMTPSNDKLKNMTNAEQHPSDSRSDAILAPYARHCA